MTRKSASAAIQDFSVDLLMRRDQGNVTPKENRRTSLGLTDVTDVAFRAHFV